MLSHPASYRAAIVIAAAVVIFIINFIVFRNPNLRIHTGFNDEAEMESEHTKKDEKIEK